MIYVCDDLHAAALMAPGAAYETGIDEHGRALFARHPHSLQALYRVAASNPGRKLVEHDAKSFTVGQIFGHAAAIARWLKARGAGQNTTVALALPGGPEWMAAFIAVTAIGGRAALINTRGVGEEMRHAVELSGCAFVFADDERSTALDGSGGLEGRCLVRVGHGAGGSPHEHDFAAIVAGSEGLILAEPESAPDHGAVILFTSGTTGFPKAVLHTHGALTHAAVLGGLLADLQDLTYAREFGRKVPPERRSASAATVIAGPMFHMGGLTPFLRGIYYGSTLFIMARWNAEVALDLLDREVVSRLGFVPTMLLDMIRSPLANDNNIGSILHLSSGAAALDPVVIEQIRTLIPQVMLSNTYGQTESAGWATSVYGADLLAHPASVGRVLPTLEMRILDADGQDAPLGGHGEILLRGACVMQEYFGDPDATAKTLTGGWLHTGDIGYVDTDGRLYIADRKKNMVVSGGENIYCAEVERVIGEYPQVAEVIAYGRPDDRLGERITATVVPVADSELDLERLRSYIRSRLAGYKAPRDIHVRRSPLPRTATQKIDRGAFLRSLN